MFEGILWRINKKKINKAWRNLNTHNETVMKNIFDINQVSVGKHTYGDLSVYNFGTDYCLKIGNYCSIGPNVDFHVCSGHQLETISTFPFKVKVAQTAEREAVGKGDIIVEDDVWIGQNATILSGVRIGQGAVVAAGAVVSKDVPPYGVVAGVPAKLIKYRFEEEIRNEMMKIDYGQLSEELVVSHIDDLYKKVESLEQLDWMPRKR